MAGWESLVYVLWTSVPIFIAIAYVSVCGDGIFGCVIIFDVSSDGDIPGGSGGRVWRWCRRTALFL